ncbi:jg5474 [Pararge aegeria aegeria]|uniref:Jg5474 protein n=1 Tax=Pararge aegeria aegeria TaxID=348720 RepID=A0A8S4SQA8_9NEOP|nr:jg5474 [Pararge aegeria aegeria]
MASYHSTDKDVQLGDLVLEWRPRTGKRSIGRSPNRRVADGSPQLVCPPSACPPQGRIQLWRQEDADFPGIAPIDAQKVHALIVNSPGNDLVQADYLTSYYPAIPYPGTGYHRYVILLFKQSALIDITRPELQNLPLNLTNFSIKDFACRYGLGDSIAGNFYLSQTIVCDQDEDISRACTLG